MQNKAIGVFDSGLGGLTTVKELKKILPCEDIIYFGDTGRVPYGNRSKETIKKYATQDVEFLKSLGVKTIIAACGTVSSVAEDVKEKIDVGFTGVVKPTSLAAYNATKNRKIGVIGTAATINSGSYERELKRLDSSLEVFSKACPLFVPLVENGFISETDPIVRMTVERYLISLKDIGVDTLILGCTHYPIIREVIQDVMGKNVTLIDAGKETALFAAKCLQEADLLCNRPEKGHCRFYVSDSVEGFSKIADLFLGCEVENEVSRVDIEQF